METAKISEGDANRIKENAELEQRIQASVNTKLEEAQKNGSQEPILVNETTKGILERQGITNVITQEELDEREKTGGQSAVVNTIAEAIKPAANEEQQVVEAVVNDESTVDLSEEEFEALARAGVTEEEILGNDERTLSQVKELAQTQLKKEQESKPSQDESSMVISDAYAEQLALAYPFAKSLKGKTMEDVMGIVSEQNSYITKLENSKGVTKDESDIDKTNSQENKSDGDLNEEDVIDLLNLSPVEATKVIKDLMKQSALAVTKDEVAKEVKKLLPNLEALQQTSNKQIENTFYGELGKQLPQDADPEKVVEEWKRVNKDMSDADKISLSNNANLLMTTIARDHKLGLLSTENTKLINDGNSEVKKVSYEKVKELLKKSKALGVNNGNFNFKRKNVIDISGEPQDAGEELYNKIITRNLNR